MANGSETTIVESCPQQSQKTNTGGPQQIGTPTIDKNPLKSPPDGAQPSCVPEAEWITCQVVQAPGDLDCAELSTTMNPSYVSKFLIDT